MLVVHTNDEIRTLTRHACRNGMTSPEVGRNLATSETELAKSGNGRFTQLSFQP